MMKIHLSRSFGLILFCFCGLSVGLSQSPPQPRQASAFAPLMGSLYSEFDFTATVVKTSQGGSTAIKMAKSGKMIRSEENLADAPGIGADPAALEHVKKMGLDITITLMNMETHAIHLIYPGKKAYAEMASPSAPAPAGVSRSKIEATVLGRETVDGHPCVKKECRLVGSSAPAEAIVWLATDLNNFPVKILSGAGENQVTTEFKKIQLGPPPAKLFIPPDDYTRYGSIEELMLKGRE